MEEIDFAIKTGNVIAYCPAFLKIKRDTKFVLFLSQVWYWSSRTKDKDGWFYKTQEDWEKELGLTPTEQKRIREILKKLGILEEKLRSLPRKVHFRLNKNKLHDLLSNEFYNAEKIELTELSSFSESQYQGFSDTENPSYCKTLKQALKKPSNKSPQNLESSTDETSQQVYIKSANKSVQKLEASLQETSNPIYTEITTETTSENTTKITTENKNFVTQARQDGEKEKYIDQIFSHWKAVMKHSKAQLDVKRKALITKALNAGYSVEALCEAISGCAKTPHNMGDNEQGQRYDGLHVILRDADQIDRFIGNYHTPPKRITRADRLTQDNFNSIQSWLAEDDGVGVIYEG